MATSGSVDFSVSRDNLIEDALRHGGVIGVEDSASSAQKTWAARLLNMWTKSIQGLGVGIWARKVGYILPQTGTNEIDLGPTGDHATLSYVQTTLSTAASDSDTTISVSSATGISASDFIGIETEDGIHWTTVSGAPSGTTITLTAGLEGDASSGAYVYAYTTKLQRPFRILEAYLRDVSNTTDTEIEVVAKQEYERMSSKTSTGPTTQLSYESLLTDGKTYIWPRFANGRYVIRVVFLRPLEDFDAATDTPDFPQEWYMAVWLNLAALCSGAGGLPTTDRAALKKEASEALMLALLNDTEEGSLRIQPDAQC